MGSSDEVASGGWATNTIQFKVRAGVLLSIFILHMVYAITTLTMFLVRARDKHTGLAQRNVRLTTLQTIGLIFVAITGSFSTALQTWPCFIKLWFCYVGFFTMYSCVAARAFQHIIVSTVHILTNKVANANNPGFKVMPQTNNLAYLSQGTGRPMRSGSQSSIFSNNEFDSSDAARLNNGMGDEKKNTMELGKHMRHESTRMDNGPEMKLYRRLQRYTRLQKYVTDRALLYFVLAHIFSSVVISLVINIVNKQFGLIPVVTKCSMVWGFIPIICVMALYIAIILPVLLVKCWSLKDAYGIRNDLIASIIGGGLCILMMVIWETVLPHIAVKWSGWFYAWLCAIILHTTSVAMPLWQAIRHSRDVIHRMHGASGLGSSMAAAIANAGGSDMGRRSEFNAILADPYEYRFFCDFAASCFCSEMTAFIDEYQALKGLTVIALGSEDIWREDVDQLEPGYMARMASNLDNGMGYLALANRNHPNAKALRLQTPPTVSILETARAVYPQYDLSEVTPFPVAAMDKLVAIFSVFVNSNSYTAVSLPSAMVLRIREKLGKSQLTLTILDEIKDEVLNMLYFDVFTRYAKKK
ncbi:hypothetical protein BX070DRAFT_218015 [Coemansia spiralis]|nr:hypothetical protein BX070DRAFT_231485 [Coemansia spiralis]KAI9506521.1 hypothetical protein BX070DRAFT_218015 [Coemansia spiralis]